MDINYRILYNVHNFFFSIYNIAELLSPRIGEHLLILIVASQIPLPVQNPE